MGVDALTAYKGSTLIYVGEPFAPETSSSERVSKTAGPLFEKSLREGGWTMQKEVRLPNWPQCEDRLQIWSRKGLPSGNSPKGGNCEDLGGNRASTSASEADKTLLGRVEHSKGRVEDIVSNAGSQEREGGDGPEGVRKNGDLKRMAETQHSEEVGGDLLMLRIMRAIEKDWTEARRKLGTNASRREREVYMGALRETWDTVANDLIFRRVFKEWRVRNVHVALKPIEMETIERHVARRGFVRRVLMRLCLRYVKDKESSE
jgi:hypothetical protein